MYPAVVVERDSSEFARLSQLGDILGLSPIEISSVHSQLAEQAYRSQVQQVRCIHPPGPPETLLPCVDILKEYALQMGVCLALQYDRDWGLAPHLLLCKSIL